MLTAQDIRRIVYDIRNSRGLTQHKDKAAFFAAKHPEFCQAFPKLFTAALDSNFPLKYLDFMLKERDVLASQPPTEEAVKERDQVVYDRLRKDFIDPLVPPPAEQ